MFDIDTVRAEFPLLNNNPCLHYLDNAATTQKPNCVIEAMSDCYRQYNAPVHRGMYKLADQASHQYEEARIKIAQFLGVADESQILFTHSTTEAINMVAMAWASQQLQAGDEIWVSRLEHHSNYLPWQRVCRQTGASLRIIELKSDGSLDLDAAEGLYGARTRLIAISHMSNVLGVITPIKQIISKAKEKGIPVLIDAAQSVSHLAVDVSELQCDFLALSAHKMYGPTGIGALYACRERIEEMEPWLLGGGMVDYINEPTQNGDAINCWSPHPAKFEAGSPDLAGAVGFTAAIGFLDRVDIDAVSTHIAGLTDYALQVLRAVPGAHIVGPQSSHDRAGIISFNIENIHPHDLGQIMAERDVAIRVGHHCCQPLMKQLGIVATARISFGLYNRIEDIDAMIESIHVARDIFLV